MNSLVIATLAFVVSHFALADPRVRPALAERLGEKGFAGIYSLLAGILLVWMAMAYARAPFLPLWDLGAAKRWLAMLVMVPVALLLVAGNSQYNPTRVMDGFDAARADPAPGVQKITRHPVMWSVALWALVHIVIAGHVAGLVFFGGLALLALIGIQRIERKRQARDPEGFARWAAATSSVPFAAIVAGRYAIGTALREIGIARILIAALLYGALLQLHGPIFGRALFG